MTDGWGTQDFRHEQMTDEHVVPISTAKSRVVALIGKMSVMVPISAEQILKTMRITDFGERIAEKGLAEVHDDEMWSCR